MMERLTDNIGVGTTSLPPLKIKGPVKVTVLGKRQDQESALVLLVPGRCLIVSCIME